MVSELEADRGCKGKDQLLGRTSFNYQGYDKIHTISRKEHKDKSSVELVRLWHEPVSPKRVLRLLKKLGYSYKKTFIHPKRDDGVRAEFIEELKKYSDEQLVFLDESGIEDNAAPLYGWNVLYVKLIETISVLQFCSKLYWCEK